MFSGATVVEVCTHHLYSEPEAPSQRLGKSLPAGLEALILRCLAKKPQDRVASARELKQALDRQPEALQWEETEAEDWWLQRDEELARPEPAAPKGFSTTIDVDLLRRKDAS